MQAKNWADYKSICITVKKLALQCEELDSAYRVIGPDGNNINWEIILPKLIPDPNNAGQMITNPDVTDFIANVQPSCNKQIVQLDSDGAIMSRVKVAPSGWNFQFRGVDFSTSTIGSVVNRDANNQDLTDATLKLYDANGALITDQSTATSSCVKSVLDIEPAYDYYITGGKMRLISVPSTDVRVAVVGVPDVPAQYGGSKAFVQNVNLKYVPLTEGVNADGRAAKWLQYSAVNHTNKIRFILYHGAGVVVPMAVLLELYKL